MKVSEIIARGITNTKIDNIHYSNENTIKKAYLDLLDPLVKDKQLLNILLQDSNLEKINNRVETDIKIYGTTEEGLLGEIWKHGQNIGKTIDDLKDLLPIGTKIESENRDIINQLTNKGYNLNLTNKEGGTITRINIIAIFRKG